MNPTWSGLACVSNLQATPLNARAFAGDQFTDPFSGDCFLLAPNPTVLPHGARFDRGVMFRDPSTRLTSLQLPPN